jgi:DNA polymerase III subunit delta'
MGHGKVFIIDEAELLDRYGQNALLKTLEQPPSQTYIILVTSRPGRLLPTIHSRCQHVVFTPLDRAAMEQWLDQYVAENRFVHGPPRGTSSQRSGGKSTSAKKKKTTKKAPPPEGALLASDDNDTPPLVDPGLARDPAWRNWVLDFADGSPGLACVCVEYELYRWGETVDPMFDQLERGTFPVGRGDALNKLVDQFADQWVERHPNASKDAANKDGLSYLLRMFAKRARRRLGEAARSGRDPHPWPGVIQLIRDAEMHSYANVNRRMVLENLVAQWMDALHGQAMAGGRS